MQHLIIGTSGVNQSKYPVRAYCNYIILTSIMDKIFGIALPHADWYIQTQVPQAMAAI